MDYDDNDAQDQNVHLTGEGSSKVSPVSHSYPLPKFDFDDNLQEHLRFDSLVENEVFLGITSQEDNQWIEEYSRETSAIPFNTSVAESRNQNVWSEATSSESVEMLLKSVGQEEKGLEETMIEELDPNLKQNDGNDPNEQSHVTFTSELQETQVSHGGLDDAVVGDKFGLSFGEKKVDKICDDANKEGSNLANEIQEDSSVFKVECGNAGSLQNVDASDKVLETHNENANDHSKNFHSSEPEHIDNICDDANEEGGNLANESFANELQEDLSVSKVEGGSAGSSQNVDASVEECQENPKEVLETPNENTSDLLKNSNKIRNNVTGDDNNLSSKPSVNELQEDSSVCKVEDASIEKFQETECANDLSKNLHSSEPEHVDKLCDDANQKGSDLGNESFVNELQDLSVSMVECENAKSSQNMDANIEERQDNPQGVLEMVNENATDLNFYNSEPKHIDKMSDDENKEYSNLASETQLLEPDVASMDQDFTFNERGDAKDPLDFKNVAIDDVGASDSQKNVEPSSFGNNAPNIAIEDSKSSPVKISGVDQVGDEIQSSELDAVSMDQDFAFSDRGDTHTTLPKDLKDMDMDVDRVPDSQKNVEPSLSAEGCEGAIVMAQGSEPNMAVLPDAVADVESSKISSPDTQQADSVTEDQPRSPILGVSLLHDNNKEKMEIEFSSEGSCQKGTPEIDTVAKNDIDTEDQPISPILGVSLLQDGNKEKVEIGGTYQKGTSGVDSGPLLVVKKDADSHGDLPVESCDVGPSEQTADDNPGGLKCSKPLETSSLPCDSSEEADNADARGLLDPKESLSREHGVEPLILTVNISNEQQASAVVAGPSERENEGGSASLDKLQSLSFSDTKSIEPSQSAKGKHDVTKGTMENTPLLEISNEGDGLQSISVSSATKEEKSFTFEVTGQIGIQNLDFSKVSSVSSSCGLLDSNKSHNDSLVTPQTPSVAPSESGPKKTSERKPRRKSVGKETAKKGNRSKEITPTRHSRTDKSPALITSENQPDLNNSTSILQQSFTDTQQVQLRAQILVYGSLISGLSPEEPHMIAAFGQSDSGRKAWEAAWRACIERVHGHGQKSQVNNPQTPLQETKIDSAQSKILSTPAITGPIVTPMTPIPSPLWNITTPNDCLQSSSTPRSALFDYRQTASPLHSFQTQRVQTFSPHNPSWASQGPLPGQWVASSPVSPFTARFSSLPITESVKLTTVKESVTPGTSVTPVQHSTGPIISPAQPSNDSKSRKRKKVDLSQASVPSPTPVAFTTPKTNPFLSPLSPGSTHHSQPRPVDQNMEKTVTKEGIMSKIEESKLQATEAAEHAAVAVTHCQDVWSQLERQKSSNLVSDDEAKLTSSAVSIAAAASVAKVAAYAAKIATNVAEQARLMADEVFLLSQPESQKATPASVSKSDHSTSVISVAREAARRRIEAASAASKHAENLDAIVKAAELAAEAVSQAGKIVAMGKPLPISELVEAGPEGYWKTPQASNKQGYPVNKQKVEGASSDKKIQTLKHGLSLQEDSGDLAKKQMVITREENDKSTVRVREGSDLSKTIGVVSELVGPSYISNADVDMPQSASPTWKDIITEGCLVEVYKDDNKNKGAWFAANVLTLKDGKAFVCYTEIQSDEGKLKEWVPLQVEGTEAPRIRIAHPMTIVRFEGTKKRGRTVFSDYAWCSGDQVDVWVQDSWHEAVVVELNKIDVTSLTVQFPDQGKTSVVRSWHVRPTLIWKDDKWIEWSSLRGNRSSEGDTPQGKRHKFDKDKEKSISVDLETWRPQESRIPTLSTQGTTFDVGKTSRVDENKQKTRGPMRSGLQKERSRVVFGVPKPGKKQKFMDVSRHYDRDGSNKNNNNTPNNSVKKIFINDSKEKQVAEVKSNAPKFRKPPIPAVVRTLAQKVKAKSSMNDKNVKDSGSVDENLPGQQKEMGVGSSSNDVSLKTPKQSLKSKVVISERSNKRKLPSGNGKATKVELKDNPTSEAEPRRSNRKIQPTSRLLEGLQSSLTISKMPTVSHSSQRSHNKVMPKGSPKLG